MSSEVVYNLNYGKVIPTSEHLGMALSAMLAAASLVR
jgi:hypothetical protein